MNGAARFGLGVAAGCLVTAVAVALAGPRGRGADAARAPESAGEAVPTDAELGELAARVAEAETRAAESAAPAVSRTPLTGAAAAFVAALRAPGAADRSAAALAHLLRRAWFELQLSDEETLIHPLRDRVIPDVLAAWDLPLAEGQRPGFEALLAWEEEAWEERARLRPRETPVERAAAALALAVRMDDWLSKILTPAQLAALSTPVAGRTPRDRRPLLGARRAPGGTAFDPRQDDAEIVLVGRWGARIGQTPGLHDAATEYVARLRDLGPAAIDETGTVPLAWGARRAALAAEVQRRWRERVPGEPAVKRWTADEVWVGE